jgi:hypothetical protein
MLHYKEESEIRGLGAVSRTGPHEEQQMNSIRSIMQFADTTAQESIGKLPINWHSSYQEHIADDTTSRTSDRLPLLLIRCDLLSLSHASLPASIMD